MILCRHNDILVLSMYIKKVVKILAFLLFFSVFFGGCEVIETILPSAGNYRLNIQVNNITLDECSFIKSGDEVYPFFEEAVSDDKDVTGLMVFLKDSKGEVIGERVIYSLEQVTPLNNDNIIMVESLDGNLPLFPIPEDLPMGRYSLVSQVMSGKGVLQRTEKSFFYLSKNIFSYEGISVYLPGIAENVLFIPRDTVIMLEVELDFDSRLDPYVIWYDGRRKVSEGKISDSAGQLFWQAPEQSGFFSLRAEVFPVGDFEGFAGYQKEISLLVSSKTINVNLISENIPQLMHWYTFDGNLNDSKMKASLERALMPVENYTPAWMGVNGTYGIVTGHNNVLSMPNILIPKKGPEIWQALFRFKHLEDGVVFSTLFGRSNDVSMYLSVERQKFVLRLISPLGTASQVVDMPAALAENSFITVGISFSIMPDNVTAQINILGDFIDSELAAKPISLKALIEGEFQVLLGFEDENREVSDQPQTTDEEAPEILTELKKTYTVLWDEFALYYEPPMEILIAELSSLADEEQPSDDIFIN